MYGFSGSLRFGVLNARLTSQDYTTGGNQTATQCRVVPSSILPPSFDPERDQAPMKLDCSGVLSPKNIKNEKRRLGSTLKRWRVPQVTLDTVARDLVVAFGKRRDSLGRPPLPILRLRLWDGASALLKGAEGFLSGTIEGVRKPELIFVEVDCRATRLAKLATAILKPGGLVAIPPTYGASRQFLFSPQSVVVHCAALVAEQKVLSDATGPDRDAAQKRLARMDLDNVWFFMDPQQVGKTLGLPVEDLVALGGALRKECRNVCSGGSAGNSTTTAATWLRCSCDEFKNTSS